MLMLLVSAHWSSPLLCVIGKVSSYIPQEKSNLVKSSTPLHFCCPSEAHSKPLNPTLWVELYHPAFISLPTLVGQFHLFLPKPQVVSKNKSSTIISKSVTLPSLKLGDGGWKDEELERDEKGREGRKGKGKQRRRGNIFEKHKWSLR